MRNSLPVLFLPGMMCDARLFARQIAALSARRTTICANLCGAESMSELADDVLADAPSVFALVGLSMGGIVAMEILRQAPHRVARLALMDTNPLAEAEGVKTTRRPQIERAENGNLAAMMTDTFIPRYLADAADPNQIGDLCLNMARALGPETFRSQSIALRDRRDQCKTLRENATMPTLILAGAHDQLCPPDRHKLMHELMPHAQLAIVEGAGHLPTLERPETTTKALLKWLEI